MSDAAVGAATEPIVIGRYALFDQLASGGMATVHLGRLLGPVGFGRTVAVKRLHAQLLKDPEFLTMFLDEARIVARIRHPNVVSTVDVVQSDAGLFLVMEYIHGESLSRLMRTARKNSERIPPRLVTAIMSGVLLGLHAAHETKGADGQLLGVVHRDVSPQNVIVGADGSARVLDFGIAKASGRAQITRDGQIKGKLAYMAPEQIRGQVDRRSDVFAASVVLWEMLTGRRLHDGAKDVDIVERVVKGGFAPPSKWAPELPPMLDEIVLRGLAVDPDARYASALELALELERTFGLATPSEVSAWVERLATATLESRANLVSAMERAAGGLVALGSTPPAAMPPPRSSPSWSDLSELSDPAELTDPGAGAPRLESAPRLSAEVGAASVVAREASSSRGSFADVEGRPADASAPSAPSAPRDPRRTSRLVMVVSVIFGAAGVVLGVFALAKGGSARTLPAAPLASAGPSGAALSPSGSSTPSAASSPGGDSAPSAAPTPSAAPSAPSAAPLGGPAPSSSGRPAVRPPAAGTPGAARPRPKAACDPPYTVDAVGHRHYKPECMGLD